MQIYRANGAIEPLAFPQYVLDEHDPEKNDPNLDYVAKRARLIREALGAESIDVFSILDPAGTLFVDSMAQAKGLPVNEAATALYRRSFELGQDAFMEAPQTGRHPHVRATTTHVIHGDAVLQQQAS